MKLNSFNSFFKFNILNAKKNVNKNHPVISMRNFRNGKIEKVKCISYDFYQENIAFKS